MTNSDQAPQARPKVLIADDIAANRDLLRQTLEPEGYDTFLVPSGEVALKVAPTVKPDVILLDISMPGGLDGFETCRQLKLDAATHGIPIIFISVADEIASVVEGFKVGGVDYVTKPFRKEEVLMRIETHVKIHRLTGQLRRRNQDLSEEIARRERAEQEREQAKGDLLKADERLNWISEQEAAHWGITAFIGQSQTIRRILDDVRRLQQVGTTSVLIIGESGTGKELIARAIHFGGSRAKGPFIPVNCAAIPRELAESFLFGHVKGAFTGANNSRKGYFELADGGTLFLDEIGEMPVELQAKLLRVLEEGCVTPLGGAQERRINVRVVAATNRNLQTRVGHGAFRQDLYFRLARFSVRLPPLRERREDIPLLIEHFLKTFAVEMGIESPGLSAGALETLQRYPFPGNIRELKNILEYALIKSERSVIQTEHLHLLETEPDPECEPVIETSSEPRSEPLAGDVRVKAAVRAICGGSTKVEIPVERAELLLAKGALAHSGGNLEAAARMLELPPARLYQILQNDEESSAVPAPQTDEERILVYIRSRGSMNNSECRDFLGVEIYRASYLLNKLHQAGLLVRKGERRWARYNLPAQNQNMKSPAGSE